MNYESIPREEYTYTKEEGLKLFIQAVKGNRECKDQRKAFNLCRATPLGKFVEPEFCKEKALNVVNCFVTVTRNQSQNCKDSFEKAVQCALRNGSCSGDLDAFLNCK